MKRYTREDMHDHMKLMILEGIGEVIEIVGNTARIHVAPKAVGGEAVDLEISTVSWYKLKEA